MKRDCLFLRQVKNCAKTWMNSNDPDSVPKVSIQRSLPAVKMNAHFSPQILKHPIDS
jgi:hypothetical protein